VRDVIEYGEVRIKKIASKENLADVFMKSLPKSRIRQCLELVNFSFKEKES